MNTTEFRTWLKVTANDLFNNRIELTAIPGIEPILGQLCGAITAVHMSRFFCAPRHCVYARIFDATRDEHPAREVQEATIEHVKLFFDKVFMNEIPEEELPISNQDLIDYLICSFVDTHAFQQCYSWHNEETELLKEAIGLLDETNRLAIMAFYFPSVNLTAAETAVPDSASVDKKTVTTALIALKRSPKIRVIHLRLIMKTKGI